jgi:hypothetical protein
LEHKKKPILRLEIIDTSKKRVYFRIADLILNRGWKIIVPTEPYESRAKKNFVSNHKKLRYEGSSSVKLYRCVIESSGEGITDAELLSMQDSESGESKVNMLDVPEQTGQIH